MNIRHPREPGAWVGWFKVVGIVCGGLIAAGTVLHFVGLLGLATAMIPVKRAIQEADKTVLVSAELERNERRAADDSLHVKIEVVVGQQGQILTELRDIHRLLLRRPYR